jgi:adenosylhomocysteine nucleosidase
MHIVCPLEFERSALRAVARRQGWALHCCGPGAPGVERWAGVSTIPRGARVVLAGVAGGLRPDLAPGTAVELAEVVEAGARTVVPPLRLTGLPAARCLAVPAPLVTVESKRAAALLHGADVVDTESAAFARVATRARWSWTIVRGVSDGAGDALPEGIEAWTDARGRTRLAPVAWAVLRGRISGGGLARLGGRSMMAMQALAAALGAADAADAKERTNR